MFRWNALNMPSFNCQKQALEVFFENRRKYKEMYFTILAVFETYMWRS